MGVSGRMNGGRPDGRPENKCLRQLLLEAEAYVAMHQTHTGEKPWRCSPDRTVLRPHYENSELRL